MLEEKSLTNIPFSVPDISQKEIDSVVSCLESGWITTGPVTKRFEKEFSGYVGVQSIATSSATAAFHLGLVVSGLQEGDEVITASLSFASPVITMLRMGIKPVLCDVDLNSCLMTPELVEKHITPKTRAILVTYYAGQYVDLIGFRRLCDKHGLMLFGDAAHCLPLFGSTGHLEDFVFFSFYATKTVAAAEGGMFSSNRYEWIERVQKLRIHGIDRDVFARYHAVNSDWMYDIHELGYKYNMPDLLASLAVVQLRRQGSLFFVRRELADIYNKRLSNVEEVVLPKETGTRSWHLYPVMADHRDDLISYLKKNGVGTSVHFIPVHMMSFWRKFSIDYLPNTDLIFSKLVSLPLYSKMSLYQIHYVSNLIENFYALRR